MLPIVTAFNRKWMSSPFLSIWLKYKLVADVCIKLFHTKSYIGIEGPVIVVLVL